MVCTLGAGNLFLLAHCPDAGRDASEALTALLDEVCRQMIVQTKYACTRVEGMPPDVAARIQSLKLELGEDET